MNNFFKLSGPVRKPSLLVSLAPVALLLGFFIAVIVFLGASAISDFSSIALLASSGLALILSLLTRGLGRRGIRLGMVRSARQIMPAVPMLVCIAMVATTWMLSGVVPTLIEYGLMILSPQFFLVVTCVVCAIISVLTGSSWSTIATIGVAFMGIGTILGFSTGWIAGAIISGAYFGDKVSPLSDTTVVASSACGVDLFKHIRYLMLTAMPAMIIALLVYLIVGLNLNPTSELSTGHIMEQLNNIFVISPWTLIIPVLTIALILLRVPTILVLFMSAMSGMIGIYIFQPQLLAQLSSSAATFGEHLRFIATTLWSGAEFTTGNGMFDELVSTSGITGMLSTISLVLSAMIFGSVMIGTGMLATITTALTSRLRGRFAIVGSTVAGGLCLNSCTADQYLSIIIGGNMFRNVYRRFGLEPRLLSRTLEDSVSVTSVLIPWNSCGVTQSTVLGVATVVYFPFCIFNYLSPLMSLLMAFTGFRIRQTSSAPIPSPVRVPSL